MRPVFTCYGQTVTFGQTSGQDFNLEGACRKLLESQPFHLPQPNAPQCPHWFAGPLVAGTPILRDCGGGPQIVNEIGSIQTGAAAPVCPSYGGWQLVGTTCRRSVPVGENLGLPAGYCASANPVNPALGNKIQVETDYAGAGPFALLLRRYYNSDANTPSPRARAGPWRHSFDRVVSGVRDGGAPAADETTLYVVREDGAAFAHVYIGDGATYVSASNPTQSLRRLGAGDGGPGWELKLPDDTRERYDERGRLTAIFDRAGRAQTLTYTPEGRLDTVTDPVGRQLQFRYDRMGLVTGFTGPDGYSVSYAYEWAGTAYRLSSATYPAASGTVRRTYRYADSRFPHALTGLVDENGVLFAEWTYDAAGRVATSRHADGADAYAFEYPTLGADAVVTDPRGTVREHRFQTASSRLQLASVSGAPNSPCGNPAAATFAGLYEASRTDWNGNVTTFERADTQRPDLETSRTEASGSPVARTITTDWHPTFRLPVRVTEPGRITETAYDTKGNTVSRTLTDSATGRTRTWTWTHTYSTVVPGMLERSVADGPRSDVADTTTTDYWPADAACPGTSPTGCRGNVRRITNALGHVTEFGEYNAHGQPTRITDPNGLVTVLVYDARQRLVSRAVGAETTSYEYDGVGNLLRTTFPDGSFLAYGYDDAHRLVEISDRLGNRRLYTLDSMGNRVVEQRFDAQGTLRATLSREFDSSNRLRTVIGGSDPAVQITGYTHDPGGNLKSIDGPLTGAPNDLWQLSYDPLDRVIESIDPLGGRSRFAHDALDRVRSVTDPRNVVTTYTVDALGNESQEVSADRGTTTRTFDSAGQLATLRDGRGVTFSYAHDALGRVTSRGHDGTLEYDGAGTGQAGVRGRLTRATRGWPVTLRYDLHGRVTERNQSAGGVTRITKYDYDSAGRMMSMTYPSGKVLTYAYDLQGRTSAISLNGAPILSNVRYFPFGAVEAFVWGNGQSYLRTFDLDGRVVSYPSGSSRRTVGYDPAGRISGISDAQTPALSFTAGHDALDRLTAYSGFPATLSFGYDAAGNRTRVDAGASTFVDSIAPSSNRLLSSTGPGPARSYTYDGMGNTLADGLRTFEYDSAGRLNGASVGSSFVFSANYNAFGERVRKGPGGTWNFAYDEGGRLIGQYRDRHLLTPQEYVYLGDQPVAILQGSNAAPEVYYIHADHLETPRVVVDAQGRVRWQWDGGAFGEHPPDQDPSGLGPFVLNLRFPGQYFDAETGLFYNYFRDYDPQTGRYVQSDPVGLAGGLNTYSYVAASPLSRVDRRGESWQLPAIGFAVGAATGAAAAYQQCQPIAAGIVVGGAVGATAGFALPKTPTIAIGVVAGGGAEVAMSLVSNQSPDWTNVGTAAFLGGWGGAVGFGLGKVGIPGWWSTAMTGLATGAIQMWNNAASAQSGCGCPAPGNQ
jgi:RHS repeat-associated protein